MVIISHEGNYTRFGAGVWLDGVVLALSARAHREATLRRWASGSSEGRVFQGREQQVAEAMRSERWVSVGGFLAAVLCDLIYLLKRSLWLHLESGLQGGRSWKARGLRRFRQSQRRRT